MSILNSHEVNCCSCVEAKHYISQNLSTCYSFCADSPDDAANVILLNIDVESCEKLTEKNLFNDSSVQRWYSRCNTNISDMRMLMRRLFNSNSKSLQYCKSISAFVRVFCMVTSILSCDRLKRPRYASCSSVRPSVCPVRTPGSKTKRRRQTKIGVNVS